MNISTSVYIGTKPRKKATNIYLPMKERQAVIKETNYQALFLLEYYLSVITRPNYLMDDKKTADATGLSLRSVKDNLSKLKKKNLFWVCRTTGNGMTNYLYCAGKEGVYCKKHFGKLFSCNTVSEIYRTHSRKQFEDILAQSNLTPMETQDITDLLDRHHDKLSKKNKHSSDWSSLVIGK